MELKAQALSGESWDLKEPSASLQQQPKATEPVKSVPDNTMQKR